MLAADKSLNIAGSVSPDKQSSGEPVFGRDFFNGSAF
jgi:hypothetical protein